LREPLPGQRPPLLLGYRRAAPRHPRRLRRGHVPADGLGVHPQAARDLDLRPARVPVLQDLCDIDHGGRPPCHLGPPSVSGRKTHSARRTRSGTPRRRRLGKTLIEGVGNYRLCREFCDADYAGWRMTRLRSSAKPARPYIWRLSILILFTVPSTLPEL